MGSGTRRSPFPCLPSDKTAGPGPKDGCFLPRARGGGHSGWAEPPGGFLDARTLPGASENKGKGKRTAPHSPETLEASPVSVGGWEAPQTGISRAADNRSVASTWDDAGAHGSLDAVSGGDGHQGIQSRVRQPLFMLLPPTSPPSGSGKHLSASLGLRRSSRSVCREAARRAGDRTVKLLTVHDRTQADCIFCLKSVQ